jgi:hypothetical protein
LLVPDRPVGEFAWTWREDGKVVPQIKYTFGEEWITRLKRGMKKFAAFLFTAGAKEVGFQHQAFQRLRLDHCCAVGDEKDQRNVCGLAPIYTLLHALNPREVKLLRYGVALDPQGSITFASLLVG